MAINSSFSGRVYHIYTVPDNSEEPSPPNAIEYDPDAMFQEYQVSANAGGMFRRFAFQRDFLGMCITLYNLIYLSCSQSASCYLDIMSTSECCFVLVVSGA